MFSSCKYPPSTCPKRGARRRGDFLSNGTANDDGDDGDDEKERRANDDDGNKEEDIGCKESVTIMTSVTF